MEIDFENPKVAVQSLRAFEECRIRGSLFQFLSASEHTLRSFHASSSLRGRRGKLHYDEERWPRSAGPLIQEIIGRSIQGMPNRCDNG